MSETEEEPAKSEAELEAEIENDGNPTLLPSDRMVTSTVRCQGPCGNEVVTDATVDVVAGAVVEEWTPSHPYVVVEGVESSRPEEEQWCTTCSKSRFDIQKSAGELRREQVTRYVTPRMVAAFASGALLALLVSVMFVV